MYVVHYGTTRFETADAIAVALVDYGLALAVRRRFAVARVPILTPDGPADARLLLGPGIALAAVDAPASSWASGPFDARDEFGSDEDRSIRANGCLDPLIVRRVVRELTRASGRLHPTTIAVAMDDVGVGLGGQPHV